MGIGPIRGLLTIGSMVAVDWFATPKANRHLSQPVAAAQQGPTTWTIGNNSYIPIPNPEYESYGPGYDRNKILKAKADFERMHPDLHVLSYELDITVHKYPYVRSFLQGIWVHHEPR